jgi:hypothetical protein
MRVARRDQQHTAAGIPEETSPPEVVEDHVIVKKRARGVDHRQDVGYPDLLYRLSHQVGHFPQFVLR